MGQNPVNENGLKRHWGGGDIFKRLEKIGRDIFKLIEKIGRDLENWKGLLQQAPKFQSSWRLVFLGFLQTWFMPGVALEGTSPSDTIMQPKVNTRGLFPTGRFFMPASIGLRRRIMPHELSCSSLLRELGVLRHRSAEQCVAACGTFWISIFVLLFWKFFFFFDSQLVPSLIFKKIRYRLYIRITYNWNNQED